MEGGEKKNYFSRRGSDAVFCFLMLFVSLLVWFHYGLCVCLLFNSFAQYFLCFHIFFVVYLGDLNFFCSLGAYFFSVFAFLPPRSYLWHICVIQPVQSFQQWNKVGALTLKFGIEYKGSPVWMCPCLFFCCWEGLQAGICVNVWVISNERAQERKKVQGLFLIANRKDWGDCSLTLIDLLFI